MYITFSNDTDSILQTLNNKAIESVTDMKDMIDTMKEIDIVYQDGDITDEHIRISKDSKKIYSFMIKQLRSFIYKKLYESLNNSYKI